MTLSVSLALQWHWIPLFLHHAGVICARYQFAPCLFGLSLVLHLYGFLHLLFKKNPLWSPISISHMHFMHLFKTFIYENLYTKPHVTVMCTGPVCPVFDQTCLLVKKNQKQKQKKKERNMEGKKSKLNYSYFWKVIHIQSI